MPLFGGFCGSFANPFKQNLRCANAFRLAQPLAALRQRVREALQHGVARLADHEGFQRQVGILERALDRAQGIRLEQKGDI